MTKGWTKRGFVPNFASAYGLKSEDRSQPPVGSLMALEIYKRHRKAWFLEEVYEELLAWNRWWPGARGCQGVLCWGSDPETQTLDGTTHNWQAALYESGLDNSPMYDGVPFDPKTNLLEMADVGLTGLYVADCNALAEIATVLGRTADSAELRGRAETYAAGLRGLWDEKAGIFLNRRTDTGEASAKLSPTNFYPLIAKVPTPAQAERIVREHYFNPAELHGEWVIPSIARNVAGLRGPGLLAGTHLGADELPRVPRPPQLRAAGRARGPRPPLARPPDEVLALGRRHLRELQRGHREGRRRDVERRLLPLGSAPRRDHAPRAGEVGSAAATGRRSGTSPAGTGTRALRRTPSSRVARPFHALGRRPRR